jgi:hypothetical protein
MQVHKPKDEMDRSTPKESENETEDEKEAKAELNVILKRSPSMRSFLGQDFTMRQTDGFSSHHILEVLLPLQQEG